MALDPKAYAEELLKEAGVSDDNLKQALTGIFTNDKVAQRLNADVLRQSDYSRSMDALRVKEQDTTNYYSSLLQWQADEQKKLDDLYKRQPTGQQPPAAQFDATAFEKKWKDELDRREQVQIGLLKTGMKLASQHAVEFKETLDTDALAKIAVDKNLSLEAAYNEMVNPRRTESQTRQYEERLKLAREEGARDALAKHKLPIDTAPREYHVMFDRDPKKQVGGDEYVPNSGRLSPGAERSLRENFVDEWNKAGVASSTSGT